MYAIGDSVLQGYAKVNRWYRLAAEQELARAQKSLGNTY